MLSYKGSVFGVGPVLCGASGDKTDPALKGIPLPTPLSLPLETGAEIKGSVVYRRREMIRVDTRTGEYMERA